VAKFWVESSAILLGVLFGVFIALSLMTHSDDEVQIAHHRPMTEDSSGK
jgi:hypothetical protein